MICLWKVCKFYDRHDNVYYEALPFNFWGHLKCCIKWYGWKGLRNTYLSERRARKKADKLTKEAHK